MGRPYNVREYSNYFNAIDTPEKAYILGILYADGCNSTEMRTISLTLKEEDLNILLKIKSNMNFPQEIKFLKRSAEKNNTGYQRKDMYKLVVTDKQISEDLVKWGCVKAKTFKLKFPFFLQKSLIRHFIRGVFDGDGCINKCTAKGNEWASYSFSIVGTDSLLSGIATHLSEVLNIKNPPKGRIDRSRKYSSKEIVVLYIRGLNNLYKLMTYLYEDSTIHLERKYTYWKNNVYEDFLTKNKHGKKIKAVSVIDGSIKEFLSIQEASKYFNCTGSNISAVLSKRTLTAKNHKWEYI